MTGTAFTLKEIIAIGWPVLSVLLFCSILSLAVMLERWFFFRKRKVDVRDYFGKIEKVLASGKEISNHASILGEPMATITRFAVSHSGGAKESLELALSRAIRLQASELERFVPMLGTIAAAAPFIGLLGTVIGIIRAFKSLAVMGGGPQVVAAGIAEALVATALGLFVAIPALVAYNYFSTKIRRITDGMEICSDGLVELLTKK